jgi:hypothetical protein
VAKQSVLWTTLPNRYTPDGKSLRLSVLASPRLDPERSKKQLSTFPDFVDWPATVAASSFTISLGGSSVTIGGSDLTGPNRIDTTFGRGELPTWAALFPNQTPVVPFTFEDHSADSVVSYDTTEIDSLARTLYTNLARTTADRLPTVTEILDPERGGFGPLVNAVNENDFAFSDEETGLFDPRRLFELMRNLPGGAHSLDVALARFQAFHTPPSTPTPVTRAHRQDSRIKSRWLEYERAELPKPDDFVQLFDFHKIVAALNQYPTLLRRLALVVDFVIDAAALVATPGAALSVAVELPATGSSVVRLRDASPKTFATLDGSTFEAVTRPSSQAGDYRTAGGLLELDPNQFSLVELDVDGAGLKLMNFARSLFRMSPTEARLDPTTRFERELGAPALRTAGLMLVHRDRASMLANAFAQNATRDGTLKDIQGGKRADPPTLYAEDLVRGFRIDVWDGTTRVWRSLCRRVADYDVGSGTVLITVPEEGTIRLAATQTADPASNPDLVYLHEVLTSWTGWSLCAPQPGKTIARDDNDVGGSDADIPAGMRLRTRFKPVEKSLPRLRYGREYWIRARVVDLAGNSLDPQLEDFGPEAPAKNATSYLRYEPIPAPAIALVKRAGGVLEKPAEGESMHRLAIRSFNVTPSDNAVPSTQAARRFALAARTNVREAEHHGVLDAGGAVDPSVYALLKQQDKALAAVEITTAGPLADPTTPAKTTFAVFQEGRELPYLPDPLAIVVSARIFDLPGWNDKDIIAIPLYPASPWPHAAPFTVEILEQPGATPNFDAATRTLRIPVPKGVRATLRLSIAPTADALALLGLWDWLTPADRTKVRALARRGQHWMFTPWRTLELVHAVQKPLLAPEMQITIERDLGATWAVPDFVAEVSLKSTDRLDLRAEWHEPTEDVAKAASGEDRARTDTAFAVKITDEKSYASILDDPSFTGIPDHEIIGPDRIRAGGVLRDRVPAKRHEFHDTRYRRIDYWLEATTRFREYMPTDVLTKKQGGKTVPSDEQIKVVGRRVTTWIPSSAPPPAPEVLYTVPTFGWIRTDDGQGGKRSWRRGAGLRVYLNRPWNASGYGEMLAVVLAPASFDGDPTAEPASVPYKNFITQWGNDPVWASPFVSGIGPARGDFPLARAAPDPLGRWLPPFAPSSESDQPPGPFKVTGLSHPPLAPYSTEGLVEIAPHDVAYDVERQLWYADIEVATNESYFPFIRLALARYQPLSLDGAHLSNIVLADFMSLAPDRWLNVQQTSDARVRRVAVFGMTYSDSAGHVEAEDSPSMSLRLIDGSVISLVPAVVSPSSVVEVWVERLVEELGEDFGWTREPQALIEPEDSNARVARPPSKSRLARERAMARELVASRSFEEVARADLIGRVHVAPTLWQGTVTLPAPPSAETRYRLVVAEYEEYLVDGFFPYGKVPTAKDRRLVFVEHIELA